MTRLVPNEKRAGCIRTLSRVRPQDLLSGEDDAGVVGMLPAKDPILRYLLSLLLLVLLLSLLLVLLLFIIIISSSSSSSSGGGGSSSSMITVVIVVIITD